MNFSELSKVAIKAARAAGETIQKYHKKDVIVEHKDTGASYASQVVTAVDVACESIIIDNLMPSCERHHIALLSEETEDDGSRFSQEYFWCVDPMDGTLAFINGEPGFSVSIALVAHDGIPYIGVVYDPSTDNMYHAIKGRGTYRNGNQWEINNHNQHLSYVTDRKLRDTLNKEEIERILLDQLEDHSLEEYREISGGGSVINAIRVLENGPACMIKMPKNQKGGGCIWDYAATSCIYHELGLRATDYHGEPLNLNPLNGPFMNEKGVYYSNMV